MALLDVDALMASLGVSKTQRARYVDYLAQAESVLQGEIDYPIEEGTRTEYLEGDGTPFLKLRNKWVSAITSVHLDSDAAWGQGAGAFPAETLLTAGTDYALVKNDPYGKYHAGIVAKLTGVWPRTSIRLSNELSSLPLDGLGNIKVVYVSGFATADVPADLKMALGMLTQLVAKTSQYGQTPSSYTFDFFSVQFGKGGGGGGGLGGDRAAVVSVEKVIARYKRWVV